MHSRFPSHPSPRQRAALGTAGVRWQSAAKPRSSTTLPSAQQDQLRQRLPGSSRLAGAGRFRQAAPMRRQSIRSFLQSSRLPLHMASKQAGRVLVCLIQRYAVDMPVQLIGAGTGNIIDPSQHNLPFVTHRCAGGVLGGDRYLAGVIK